MTPSVLVAALMLSTIGGAMFADDADAATTQTSTTTGAATHAATHSATTHATTTRASTRASTRHAATQRAASAPKKAIPAELTTEAMAPAKESKEAKEESKEMLGKIPAQMRVNLAWQIALEAVDFSPGILDGHFGRKSQMALSEYAARFFPGKDKFDPEVFLSLNISVEEAVASYTITVDDAAKIGPLPDDWNEKAKLDRLTYDTMIDYIAEKFHSTRALLQALNPGVKFHSLDVGQTLLVPNIRPFPTSSTTQPGASTRVVEKADRIEINLAAKTIRVYDRANTQIALFHCSVAKDKAKLPDRDAVVKTIAVNPEYKFDPKYWPEVNNVDRILIIKPGPRNPVGSVWIGLDLPGYGIHGNPKPELIGKTGSHGCFRLTNWDALKLVSVARIGMPVRMINPEKEGQQEKE